MALSDPESLSDGAKNAKSEDISRSPMLKPEPRYQ